MNIQVTYSMCMGVKVDRILQGPSELEVVLEDGYGCEPAQLVVKQLCNHLLGVSQVGLGLDHKVGLSLVGGLQGGRGVQQMVMRFQAAGGGGEIPGKKTMGWHGQASCDGGSEQVASSRLCRQGTHADGTVED
jgi:hypothetical protein